VIISRLLIKRSPTRQGKALDRFDSVWCKNNCFVGDEVESCPALHGKVQLVVLGVLVRLFVGGEVLGC
jgi:hypothetical protein